MTSRGQEKGLQPYEALDCFGWRCGGEWKAPCFSAGIFIPCWFFRQLRPEGGAGKQQAERTAVRAAPIVCPEESPCVFSPTTARRGCRGASGKPPCIASLKDNFAARDSPRWGLTRRLRRGLGLAVPWGAHTFLSVAKEKCAKESQRHGDSRGGPPRCASRASSCGSPFGAVLVLGSLRSPAGKKASNAHFGGGARYVARSRVSQLTPTIARARSSPFSAVKMGGPFSLRCLSPLCSPAVGVGQPYPLQVGMLRCDWKILRQ